MRKIREGWLLVRRYRLTREPVPPLTQEQANNYRGFDGYPWPQDTGIARTDGLADPTAYDAIRSSKSESDDLVYLCIGAEPGPISAAGGMRFLGFDFGYFANEYSHFSSVLSEVAFGSISEMTRFAARLNQSLLLETLADVTELRRLRESLGTRRGLETIGPAEALSIIAMFERQA